MSDDPVQSEEPRDAQPLPYRSGAADYRDLRERGLGRRSSFAMGCLTSIVCVIVLIAITFSGRSDDAAMRAWIDAGPALLAIGVAIGTRRRDWGFFLGALASVVLVLSFIGLVMAICR
jgi:hypothetical protein